jgi:hypothetical protein
MVSMRPCFRESPEYLLRVLEARHCAMLVLKSDAWCISSYLKAQLSS